MARPRKHDYDGSTSRLAASRAALRAAGGARATVTLQPDGKAALDALVKSTGATASEIVNRLLVEAWHGKA